MAESAMRESTRGEAESICSAPGVTDYMSDYMADYISDHVTDDMSGYLTYYMSDYVADYMSDYMRGRTYCAIHAHTTHIPRLWR